MTLNPALFTTSAADGVDTTKLRPSNWNRVVAILNSILDGADATGGILLRDATDAVDGATWLPDVAAGSVLVSGGVGVAPAWSASPSLTRVLLGDGTAGAPSVAFSSETNTGFRWAGTNTVVFDSTGTDILQFGGGIGLVIHATNSLKWGSAGISTPDTALARGGAAGKVTLTGTTPMLQIGGTTSSFPALKRNAAVLEARLADDSAYAVLQAAGLTLNAGTGGTGGAGVQIFSSIAAAGNVNTGETDLISYSMPANTLAVDGQKIRITVGGQLAANANAKTIKLYFGSTVLVTDNGTINSGGFRLTAEVVRTGAATQVSNATSMMLRALLNGYTAPSETLSGAITIKVSGQSGTASNDVIAKYMIVEWLPQ